MDKQSTNLAGVFLLKPPVYKDHRGRFTVPWNKFEFDKLGLPSDFLQDCVSYSAANVIRGLHYQKSPQSKLITVPYGEIFDVVVDMRKESPTFGQYQSFQISSKASTAIWIPAGFAHGFASLKNHTMVCYKMTDVHRPEMETTVHWNDPDLSIDWPINRKHAIVSQKDQCGTPFKSAPYF